MRNVHLESCNDAPLLHPALLCRNLPFSISSEEVSRWIRLPRVLPGCLHMRSACDWRCVTGAVSLAPPATGAGCAALRAAALSASAFLQAPHTNADPYRSRAAGPPLPVLTCADPACLLCGLPQMYEIFGKYGAIRQVRFAERGAGCTSVVLAGGTEDLGSRAAQTCPALPSMDGTESQPCPERPAPTPAVRALPWTLLQVRLGSSKETRGTAFVVYGEPPACLCYFCAAIWPCDGLVSGCSLQWDGPSSRLLVAAGWSLVLQRAAPCRRLVFGPAAGCSLYKARRRLVFATARPGSAEPVPAFGWAVLAPLSASTAPCKSCCACPGCAALCRGHL